MTRHYMVGILMLLTCTLLEVYTFPANAEASVQYLPFYGGARGQYLEIKKDNSGKVTGEKIVSEENISSENVIKDRDENLLVKVMVANLQNLKTLSTNLLRLTNLGRKTGNLGNIEKNRYKTQLASLGEAASNIIKLIDEVEDIDVLFRKNTTLRHRNDADDEYVVEEGIGVEASNDDDFGDVTGADHIAEARPVGVAVVNEGLAVSRPMGTAIASSGVAIARPIATAISGVDPAALGVNFQVNHGYSNRS